MLIRMLAVCVLALLHSAVETNAFVAPGLHSLQPSLQHAQTTRPHARFLPALDRRQRSSTTFQLLATAAAEPIVIEPVSKKDVNRLRVTDPSGTLSTAPRPVLTKGIIGCRCVLRRRVLPGSNSFLASSAVHILQS